MKKIILSIFAIFVFCSMAAAEGISFKENQQWKALLDLAKKEHKLIFLDAYASWCGPCKYLQEDVFTLPAVGDYFNSTYINVRIDMETGEGPEIAKEFGVTAYPTLFFVNGDGKVLHKYVGALSGEDLLQLGKAGNDPDQQYYTLKLKAAAGTLAPKAFHKWIHQAEKMEDEDLAATITAYLENANPPLDDPEMLNIIFEHASVLSEKLMDNMVMHKSEIKQLMEFTEADFNEALTKKAVSFALEKSVENDLIDFNKFKELVTRYSPESAELETQLMQVKYYFYKTENEKALDAMAVLVGGPLKLTAFSLASIVADHAGDIVTAQRETEFINKLNSFKLNPDENDQGYYVDFALLTIYSEMKNKAQAAAMIAKINSNDQAPAKLKELAERFVVE